LCIVKPIFKKGDKLTTLNYRPALLLTSFSKVFEKLIFLVIQHRCANNIVVNEHYGFRNNPDLPVPLLFTTLAGGESLQIQRVTLCTQPCTVDRGYTPACGD